MMYRIIPFGHHHEQEVPLIVLFNEQLSVELLPFGAAVRALWVPDRTGERVDVVLGYDDLVNYETLDACLGGHHRPVCQPDRRRLLPLER